MRVFVLGAPDPEMHAIEALLKARGEVVLHAYFKGSRANVHTAYQATDVVPALPANAEIVFVECSVMGLRYDDLIDHHRPGDPGYDMLPEQYMQGSSLGQILSMFNIEPTEEQRIICAADHCLTYAYQGRCPGVTPQALQAWRASVRAARQKLSVEAFERHVEAAHRKMLEAEKIVIEGVEVAWVGDLDQEYAEAGSRFGIPYMGTSRAGRETCVTIFGVAPNVIRAWVRSCGLKNTFGAPERGYAGGYA